jgi:MFS family permease
MKEVASKSEAKLAGCQITKEDTPILIRSVICCFAYGIYGIVYSSLSAALPQLADHLNKESASFGIAYTTRGMGYLFGTLVSAYLLNLPSFQFTKTFCCCVSLILSGISTLIVGQVDNFGLILAMFFFQGIGFGGVDMMANCAIPEMWELRAQPWLQG